MHMQATWLLQLARQDEDSARKDFASIPEYVIRDMTGWLSFVIQSGQADLVASCRLDILISFLTEMLQRLELVQSPIVHAKICALLLAMLSPQLGRRRQRGLPSLSPTPSLCSANMHELMLCHSLCLCFINMYELTFNVKWILDGSMLGPTDMAGVHGLQQQCSSACSRML